MSRRTFGLKSLIASALAGVMFMSACSVDLNGVQNAITDLGDNLSDAVNKSPAQSPAETSASEETFPTEEEPEAAETSPETSEPEEEPSATPTPLPSATPTPSPTPLPQRVDFSALTEDPIYGTINVLTEDFGESAHAQEDDDIVLAAFTGNRVLISSDESSAPVTAVNMMLDAFYMEAQGEYDRAVAEQYAAYALDPETVFERRTVTVEYETYFNGRILGVVMNMECGTQNLDSDEDGEEDLNVTESAREYLTFDLYTGQIVLPQMLYKDVDAFYTAIGTIIAGESASRRDTASDYEIEFIGAQSSDGKIELSAYAVFNGELMEYEVDMPELVSYLTMYGKTVWDITGYPDGEEEDDSEEDIEQTDEEDTEDEAPGEDPDGSVTAASGEEEEG